MSKNILLCLFISLIFSNNEMKAQSPAETPSLKPKEVVKEKKQKKKKHATKKPSKKKLTPLEELRQILPSWGAPGFDWALAPHLNFSIVDVKLEGLDSNVYSVFEYGGHFKLAHIPLDPGNPGFTISPAISFIREDHKTGIDLKKGTLYDNYLFSNQFLYLFYFLWLETDVSFGLRNLENRTDLGYYFKIAPHIALKESRIFSTHWIWAHHRHYDHVDRKTHLTATLNDIRLFERIYLPSLRWKLDVGPGYSLSHFTKDDISYHSIFLFADSRKRFPLGINFILQAVYVLFSEMESSESIPQPPISDPIAVPGANQPDNSYTFKMSLGRKLGFVSAHYIYTYKVDAVGSKKEQTYSFHGWVVSAGF